MRLVAAAARASSSRSPAVGDRRGISPARRSEIIDALRPGHRPGPGPRRDGRRPRPLRRSHRRGAGQGRRRRGRVQGRPGRVRVAARPSSPAGSPSGPAPGFATAEIQISETETPLHHLQTVYRRIIERLVDRRRRGRRPAVGGRRVVLRAGGGRARRRRRRRDRHRGRSTPPPTRSWSSASPSVVRTRAGVRRGPAGYRPAIAGGRHGARPTACWPGSAGNRNVAAPVKRAAGIKGEIDHDGRPVVPPGPADHPARHRPRRAVARPRRGRDAAAGALRRPRQVAQRPAPAASTRSTAAASRASTCVITGTPAFFDGPQGVQRLAPLAQRLAHRLHHRRPLRQPPSRPAPPAGLRPRPRWSSSGTRVRDLYAAGARDPARIAIAVDDAYVGDLAHAVTGALGGKVGIAPRVFLKKLVDDRARPGRPVPGLRSPRRLLLT